ncbi:MAG: NAD(P)H-dependent oxidoreductase subunit E [Oscillospiraceae bacterium]|nr:NAD(P)H-dependent oxidoreductase subunit E [Oscillospiraceae bacterium]
MNERFDVSAVDVIIDRHGCKPSSVISILQEIQEHYRYLPQEAFSHLATRLGLSCARIYSVATFYENFSLEPKGKNIIKICDGTACHVRHSIPILNAMRNALMLTDKKTTTDDGLFTIETVSCLGACGLAPVITVNDHVNPAVTPDSAVAILNELKEVE